MKYDIALYSALYGGYDAVPGVDCDVDMYSVLYVDNQDTAMKAMGRGWREVRIVNHHLMTFNGDPAITAPMLAHKYWKMFAGKNEAKVTVWMDASMTITRAKEFKELCLEAISEADIAIIAHPWRNCIYEEAEFSASLPRYASLADNLRQQASYYQSIGHPHHAGLHATGFYIRRDNSMVRRVMSNWWWECITRTHQDQVSLPVVLRLEPGILVDQNIPWHDGPDSWTSLGYHLK